MKKKQKITHFGRIQRIARAELSSLIIVMNERNNFDRAAVFRKFTNNLGTSYRPTRMSPHAADMLCNEKHLWKCYTYIVTENDSGALVLNGNDILCNVQMHQKDLMDYMSEEYSRYDRVKKVCGGYIASLAGELSEEDQLDLAMITNGYVDQQLAE